MHDLRSQITDNGQQFTSTEFSVFARTRGFDHVTSSSTYPQSNIKAENAVKMIKQLFKKCNESIELPLLDWQNTPTEGVGTSPAQPLIIVLLKPYYDIEAEAKTLKQRQRKKHYYNRSARPLRTINPGETVRII